MPENGDGVAERLSAPLRTCASTSRRTTCTAWSLPIRSWSPPARSATAPSTSSLSTSSGSARSARRGSPSVPGHGNPPPRIAETPAGMLNAIGLQNVGLRGVVQEKAPIWARWSVPVIANISGESIAEFEELAGTLDGVPGIAGLEVNISCPNIRDGGRLFADDAASAAAVTRGLPGRHQPAADGQALAQRRQHRRDRAGGRGGRCRRALGRQHAARAC